MSKFNQLDVVKSESEIPMEILFAGTDTDCPCCLKETEGNPHTCISEVILEIKEESFLEDYLKKLKSYYNARKISFSELKKSIKKLVEKIREITTFLLDKIFGEDIAKNFYSFFKNNKVLFSGERGILNNTSSFWSKSSEKSLRIDRSRTNKSIKLSKIRKQHFKRGLGESFYPATY